jgi:uncharacterized membrane protein
MMAGWAELRSAAVLGVSTLVFFAACDRDTDQAARGKLGATELPWASPGGADGSPSGQGGAPSELGTGGTRDPHGDGGARELGDGGARELGDGGAREFGDGGAPDPDEGDAGAGGAPVRACDHVANVVPTTCPVGGPTGAYRETGLGFLEVTGWHPSEPSWPAISSARAINARGDVVGSASLCGMMRAILYRAGVLLDLDPIPGALHAFAWDVNDEGDVLGEVDGGTAFVWKNGVTTVLSGVGPGSPIAINNLGQVLGVDQDGAYIWDAGLVTRLGFSRNTRVTDLNDRGQVTGYHRYEALPAFVWEAGVITALPPLPGDDHSTALAINEAGQVVGSSVDFMQPGAAGRAVLWDSFVPFDITPPTDHPLVDSAGLDINESGVVLGHFQEDGPRLNSAAFIFDHGVTTRIFPEDPTVGAALAPSAINDAGEIAGTTLFWTGSPHQATVWSRGCFGACCE